MQYLVLFLFASWNFAFYAVRRRRIIENEVRTWHPWRRESAEARRAMKFVHDRTFLEKGDAVIVEGTAPCNIRLLDDANFTKFRTGRTYRYFGGTFEDFPARVAVPATGTWNITLDRGGH